MWATIIVDASFCPDTKVAAWACWVRYDGGALLKHAAVFKVPVEDANSAERFAAINAIAACLHCAPSPVSGILLQTDCMTVVQKLTQIEITDALKRSDLPPVRIIHVKGHTKLKTPRHWCNRWCDAAAKRLMRKCRP